ncbi:MAG: hypothetical protein ABFD81_03445 [Syntrophaceae bacterium]
MKIVKRTYRAGDERAINQLYKRVTGNERSGDEYRWEWLETWDGQGNIWLAFDEDREDGDRLIMQYSLIPTPISFWGKPYLAGKTENCMSHPDCRGTGVYFPHEKEGFEDAKRRFQLFFTTAGNRAKGAPGAVRRKLGYKGLDAWVEYFYLTDSDYINRLITRKLSKKLGRYADLLKYFSYLSAKLILVYFRPASDQPIGNKRIELFDCRTVPLAQIEQLWNRNKALYGITIDRTCAYLDWRINRNPCFNHRYLVIREDEKIIGYVIFYLNSNNVFRVVDVMADQKQVALFTRLFRELVAIARKEKAGAVVCSTVEGNKLLREVLRKSGFVCRESLSFTKHQTGKSDEKSFLIYVSESIPDYQRAYDPANWYITALVKEGRR